MSVEKNMSGRVHLNNFSLVDRVNMETKVSVVGLHLRRNTNTHRGNHVDANTKHWTEGNPNVYSVENVNTNTDRKNIRHAPRFMSLPGTTARSLLSLEIFE